MTIRGHLMAIHVQKKPGNVDVVGAIIFVVFIVFLLFRMRMPFA